MTNHEYVIDVRDLCKSFTGKQVVNSLTIQMQKGEIYGFLGPNGSGKTTTIRMICGLLTPDSGSGNCLGYDLITESDLIKAHVGYMTQKFSYWADLTIKENLEFVADMFAINNKEQTIMDTLLGLGLSERQNQLTGSLSGGWKQRLALAACTLHKPKILLLDEPTAGVDPNARREFWDEIHRLANAGLTVLVSTHYMDEAARCHKIIYIADGDLIVQGSAPEVIKKANLTTWVARGKCLDQLSEILSKNQSCSIARFGDNLNISSSSPSELSKAMAPF